jgi:hypothetical protein
MDTEQAINAILEDLEHQPLQKSRTFLAYLNAPELISLSSTNAVPQSSPINPQTDNSYYNFQVNLPRPAINAKSLQLLKAVIPQAQTSIPDYSLVFPYYKLRTVPTDNNGTLHFVDTPSYNTLNFIRLLPSSYKPEIVDLSANIPEKIYGYNRTFADYDELLTELNKACADDPQEETTGWAFDHYRPGDVSFEFNEQQNKFVFVGNNVSTPNGYDEWDVAQLYSAGDVVTYDEIDYLCIEQTIEGPNPSINPTEWLNVSQFYAIQPKYNAYLIAGYNDLNVKLLLREADFYTTNFDQELTTSIPGNKYVESQTLARRLGFTWDSTGMVTTNINQYYTSGVLYGSTTALFYNRIRPIAKYEIIYPELFLPDVGIMNLCNKYTADGYCNLVYSSIINIYTTIIGTSSVDTQRNANLIGTIEMNCGNLGVAFGNNYIDTKLTKIQSDIYSIFIELRDENGEPYYLTNNATTTFLLKLTY